MVGSGKDRGTPCRRVLNDSVWFDSALEQIFKVTGSARFSLWLFRSISNNNANNAMHEAESKCYIASEMTWLPFLPQLISKQLLFSPEDPKPDTCRYSAEPTHSYTFLPSAVCLWNALPVDVCQLPPDSFKAQVNTIALTYMPAGLVLIHCTALFLSAMFVLLFVIPASALCT